MIKLPNYKIIKKIGEGGMATVYKAVHTSLNKEVAIKCLNSEFYGNENIRKRFIAEARTLFTLSHPNLTKVTDLIKTDDVLAIVMEYIDGKSLKEYISDRGALDAVEIKKIFSKILDGVAYIHRKGFIHRDIKPSNFMIDNNGDLKILDFGIAKNLDTSSAEYTMTGTSQMMGTPMYMSPEQIKSTKDITIQTDIYSLGVVLWNMATGTKPYDQNTLSIPEIQVSILKEDLGLTNTVFDKIIQEATKKDTDVRLKKCKEFNINNISLKKDVIDDDKTIIDVVDDDKTIIDVVDDDKTLINTSINDEKTVVNNIEDSALVDDWSQQSDLEIVLGYEIHYAKSLKKEGSSIHCVLNCLLASLSEIDQLREEDGELPFEFGGIEELDRETINKLGYDWIEYEKYIQDLDKIENLLGIEIKDNVEDNITLEYLSSEFLIWKSDIDGETSFDSLKSTMTWRKMHLFNVPGYVCLSSQRVIFKSVNSIFNLSDINFSIYYKDISHVSSNLPNTLKIKTYDSKKYIFDGSALRSTSKEIVQIIKKFISIR